MNTPDFKRLGILAQSFADMICDLPSGSSEASDEEAFGILSNYVWDASGGLPPGLIREQAAALELVKPKLWYLCAPLEQRWWLAFGRVIVAARQSVQEPTMDFSTVVPKRPRISVRDTIFEEMDGFGARTYGDEDDALNRRGKPRTVSSKQVIVTRPVPFEVPEQEAAAPPYSAEQVDAMRQQLTPAEIMDLKPADRAAYAAQMGFPSESGGVPAGWRKPVTVAPPMAAGEVKSVSAQVDGETLTGTAVVSQPQE